MKKVSDFVLIRLSLAGRTQISETRFCRSSSSSSYSHNFCQLGLVLEYTVQVYKTREIL